MPPHVNDAPPFLMPYKHVYIDLDLALSCGQKHHNLHNKAILSNTSGTFNAAATVVTESEFMYAHSECSFCMLMSYLFLETYWLYNNYILPYMKFDSKTHKYCTKGISFKTWFHNNFTSYMYNVYTIAHDDVIKMEALLALCAVNSPITGEFPSQRSVMRSFDVFFDLCLDKRLSKQSWGWWFETSSSSLWRHCNDNGFSPIFRTILIDYVRNC